MMMYSVENQIKVYIDLREFIGLEKIVDNKRKDVNMSNRESIDPLNEPTTSLTNKRTL